jgi:hypothetical protein
MQQRLLVSMKHSIYIVAILLFFGSEAFGQGSVDTCNYLYDRGHRLLEDGLVSSYLKSNDTLRLFIERCATSTTAADGSPAYTEFGDISADVSQMDTSNGRWLDYRSWLKKVLYLNVDTNYYCSDVEEMFTTFQYYDPEKGIDYNSIVSIVDYLLATNRCPVYTNLFLQRRAAARKDQIRIWRDTVTDSLKTPIDTSEQNIDSIGFSILRGPQHNLVLPSMPYSQTIIASLTSTLNPFKTETTLEFVLNRMAYITADVYDVLGHKVWGSDRGGTMDAGAHQMRIDGAGMSSGIYYSRISTGFGEVKTVKLVKE